MSLRCLVDREIERKDGWYGRYICDCGNVVMVRRSAVRYGNTSTCGCSHGERHGQRLSAEYNAWVHMRQRCMNPKNAAWADYGGRGIQVAEEWRTSFLTFLRDIGHRPSAKHSLDRIDNNGNYERRNVRWATKAQQANNRRRRRWWKRPM